MLFRNEESSLRLDIVNYGFPPDGGDPPVTTETGWCSGPPGTRRTETW